MAEPAILLCAVSGGLSGRNSGSFDTCTKPSRPWDNGTRPSRSAVSSSRSLTASGSSSATAAGCHVATMACLAATAVACCKPAGFIAARLMIRMTLTRAHRHATRARLTSPPPWRTMARGRSATRPGASAPRLGPCSLFSWCGSPRPCRWASSLLKQYWRYRFHVSPARRGRPTWQIQLRRFTATIKFSLSIGGHHAVRVWRLDH
jgi:hypothetical protein